MQESRAGACDQVGRPANLSLLLPCWAPTERDVSRTDRTNKFYEGPENPGLGLLNDILLTYCMYHFDLGERCTAGRRLGVVGAQGVAADPVFPQAMFRA